MSENEGAASLLGARGGGSINPDGAMAVAPDGGDSKPASYQPRLATIASIVNTMMGTTILALPYGFSQSGIVAGLLIILVLGAVSCYTCLIVVEQGLRAGHSDFSGSVEAFLGPRCKLIAWAFSVAIILGAAIVYHILMQETLFTVVSTVLSSVGGGGTGGWSRVYAALVPWIVYPICNFKDLSLLVKFNSVGFLFLGYTVVFMLYHGAWCRCAPRFWSLVPFSHAFTRTR